MNAAQQADYMRACALVGLSCVTRLTEHLLELREWAPRPLEVQITVTIVGGD